jgi:hypothetical protein
MLHGHGAAHGAGNSDFETPWSILGLRARRTSTAQDQVMKATIAPGHDGLSRADVPGQQACWTRTAFSRSLRCWRSSNKTHREGELHQGQGKWVDRMCQHRVHPCLIWSDDSEYIRDPRPATWYEHKQLLSNSNPQCGQMDRPGWSGDRMPKSPAGPRRARPPEKDVLVDAIGGGRRCAFLLRDEESRHA